VGTFAAMVGSAHPTKLICEKILYREDAKNAKKCKCGIHHPLGCASLEDTEEAEEIQESEFELSCGPSNNQVRFSALSPCPRTRVRI
jgi:hypothetical protein